MEYNPDGERIVKREKWLISSFGKSAMMISAGDASASENKILVYKSFSQKYLMPAKKTTYKFIGSTEIYLEDAAKIHLCPGKSQSCN